MIKIRERELLKQINALRMKMIESGTRNGLGNIETINISRELDNLLLDYQLLAMDERELITQ